MGLLSEARAPLPEATPAAAPAAVRRVCLVVVAAAAVYLAGVATRAVRVAAPDFEYFYKAGAHLLTHGALDEGADRLPDGRLVRRGTIEWYLPFVSRLMTLLAWLPLRTAGAVWVVLNLAAFVATLLLLGRRLIGLPPQDWPVTLLVPLVIVLFFWHWEFRLNQIDTLTLLLVVASFLHWEQQRSRLAGFELGLAVLLKLTPALLVVWFALKRQFRTAGFALLTVLVFGPLADLVVFRPAYALEAYRGWLERAAAGSSHYGLVLHQREMDWRNQGLGAVASRWLHPTNYALHFDNDPRIRTYKPPATMNLTNLPPRAIGIGVAVLIGASLAGLLWLARRPARQLGLWQLRGEWALFIVAMLWSMPVLRRYHLVFLLPALCVLASAIHYAGRQRRWSRLALGCILGVVGCQLAVATRTLNDWRLLSWLDRFLPAERAEAVRYAVDAGLAEAAGVLLLAVVLLAVPLVALLLWLARRPDALPLPAYGLPPAERCAAR